uniref:Uncharacterized protein n=1 Tax=Candidatus Kentrum sp. FM TaxID=2126340 RepID=A0A450WLA1_9GAMM|nr:MAG: hypothetical protein BECKFM1743B_GA0114221_105062 [Candidatus Kentron sp. FM]
MLCQAGAVRGIPDRRVGDVTRLRQHREEKCLSACPKMPGRGRIFLLGERCTVPTDGSIITKA